MGLAVRVCLLTSYPVAQVVRRVARQMNCGGRDVAHGKALVVVKECIKDILVLGGGDTVSLPKELLDLLYALPDADQRPVRLCLRPGEAALEVR